MKVPPAPSMINHRKLKVDDMHPEIASDQNYDDHYANYSEDVHRVVLQLPDKCEACEHASRIQIGLSV
jgi:hypothetical protein